jgi:transmembrane sensor
VFSLRDTDRSLANLALSLPVQLRYRTRYWVSVGPRQAS